MNYQLLKKEELIKLLEEQKHLAEAVIAKDKEIVALTKEINEVREQLREAKNKNGTVPALEHRIKQLEDQVKGLTEFVSPYIMNFRSTLKGIQGALELGIELEAILSEKLNKK